MIKNDSLIVFYLTLIIPIITALYLQWKLTLAPIYTPKFNIRTWLRNQITLVKLRHRLLLIGSQILTFLLGVTTLLNTFYLAQIF